MKMGLCGTLFCIFLVLKLVGTIDWSWWWVTAPLWIVTAVLVLAGFLKAVAEEMEPKDSIGQWQRQMDKWERRGK